MIARIAVWEVGAVCTKGNPRNFHLHKISFLNFPYLHPMKIAEQFQRGPVHAFRVASWPFGRPKMFVHLYYLDGLLIDTGHPNMRKEIMEMTAPLEVSQMFITHHHEDHSGNISVLQKQFQCPVRSSSLCAEIMKNPPRVSPAQWLTWGQAPAYHDLQPEDQLIKTPNYDLELIPIPGHAKDMMALYVRSEGWLFAADLWVSSYIRYFMRVEGMREQITSLKRVLELDVELLFCSHRPQFEDVKAKLAAKLQFFEDFYGQVAHWHAQGNKANGIMKKMELKPQWFMRMLSTGNLSTLNMVKAVIREEKERAKKIIGDTH